MVIIRFECLSKNSNRFACNAGANISSTYSSRTALKIFMIYCVKQSCGQLWQLYITTILMRASFAYTRDLPVKCNSRCKLLHFRIDSQLRLLFGRIASK